MRFRNAFLSAMESADIAALAPELREVNLSVGQLLSEAGDLTDSVYFPSGAIVSVVVLLADGRSYETSSVGFEGVAGLLPALTEIPASTRMFVQIGGGAIRLPAAKLRARAAASPALMTLILKHVQINAGQAEQSVACNASHQLSARLARWLLISQDRVGSATLLLTQDYLGVMTGGLRSSISMCASAFKRAGLIGYSRGRLEILDRDGLKQQACECYAIDQAHRLSLFADD